MDCLITQLKGSVTRDLPFFDAIRLRIKWGNESSFAIKPAGSINVTYFGGNGTKVSVITNGNIEVGGESVGQEYTLTSDSTGTVDITPEDATQDTLIVLRGIATISHWGRSTSAPYRMAYTDDMPLLIGSSVNDASIAFLAGDQHPCNLSALANLPNKGAVTTLLLSLDENAYEGDISYLGELPGLLSTGAILAANSTGVFGDISVFEGNTTIRQVQLRRNDHIVGMIDSLAGCSAITVIDLQSTSITGNLASLGSLASLNSLVIASTSVTGTVEELVAAFVEAGRTSGSITIGFSNTGITYNGQPVTGTTLTWNGTSISIS